jgi:hypothetical protein
VQYYKDLIVFCLQEISKRFLTDAIAAGAHKKQGALTAARTACAAAMTQLASRFGKAHVSCIFSMCASPDEGEAHKVCVEVPS